MTSRSLPYVMALLAAAAALVPVWIVDRFEQERFHEASRASVVRTLSTIRARLEGSLNARLFLTRGLVGYVSTHPGIDEQEFQALAKVLLAGQSDIRSIELAKNTVVTHIHPVEGNEKARGLRPLDLPNQRAAVQRALDTRNTVVAGPVDLVEGGVAFVSRTPIYLSSPGGPPASGRYWGLATVLVDKDTILREAGIFDDSAELQYALRGKDGLGAHGEVFWGDPAIYESNPIVLDVYLPNGSWQLAAIPVGGWSVVSPRLSLFRIGGALLAIMAAGLAFFATLTRIRLREREQALQGSEKRYRVLYEDNPAMYFTVDREGTVLSVNRFGAEQLGYEVDELLGQSVLNVFHPDDRDAVLRQFNGCFENAEQLFRWEFRKVHKDGGVIWVREAARAVRATDGKTLALIVCEDITELKRAEESLRQAHDELELRVEERTALLSSTVAALERQMAERKWAEAALRDSQKDLQDLAGKLLTAQEEERRRLARELHDDLTQRLAVLAIEAGRLEQQLHGAAHPVLERLRHMKEQIVKLSADVHGISRQLHPSILDDLGLVSAMESECANLTQREGIAVKYESHNVPTTLPRDVALCLYRIAQEALWNIAKHAKTTEAYVALVGTGDAITLSVWDDGVGFDPAQLHRKPGLGLASMEERVRLIRGHLSIQSEPGKGTIIEAWAPVAGGDASGLLQHRSPMT